MICISIFGIRIKNISAAQIDECNNGVRDYFTSTDALLHNSLFSMYIIENGLRVHGDSTRDIVSIDFDYGTRGFQEEIERIEKKIAKTEPETEENIRLLELRDKILSRKDMYCKKSREKLRKQFYTEGVSITWPSKKGTQTIRYSMLYRTPAKAKMGSCMFIREELYDKAIKWLTMGLNTQLPERNAKIVELSAYAPLTTSTIIQTIKIPVDDVLILRDQDSFFRTIADVVTAEDYAPNPKHPENKVKRCKVTRQEVDVKNTLWDGMALVESRFYDDKSGMKPVNPKMPVSYLNGMMLLRNHFFKACAFRANIRLFFQDWCKQNNIDFLTYQVEDMFGRKHYLKDIKMITTDNAIKWKKFIDCMTRQGTPEAAYEFWRQRIIDDGNLWGVVKTDHPSHIYPYQQMSYQMVNTLPMESRAEIDDVLTDSIDYISRMRTDTEFFISHLRHEKNDINGYDMFIALYEHNPEIANTEWFRREKTKIIASYVKRVKSGKVRVYGDNLTACGNPYALLLYAAGDDWDKDTTMRQEDGCVQCYTTRFKDGEYLAAFRSPCNSSNNNVYLHNVYSPEMQKYFPFSKNIIALNCIGTDIQPRLNGADFDSDFVLVTNQPTVVKMVRRCVDHYPTIVNELQESGITYNNTKADYAKMDSTFAKSQMGIGESSNIAQLAITYAWTEINNFRSDDDRIAELQEVSTIMAVIAQVLIDSCKRLYEVDGMAEVKRISKLECMQMVEQDPFNEDKMLRKDFPEFFNYARTIPVMKYGKPRPVDDIRCDQARLRSRVNYRLICPMNIVCHALDEIPSAPRTNTLDIQDFFIKDDGRADGRQISKIALMADELRKQMYLTANNDAYMMIVKDHTDSIVEKLRRMKIRNAATINRLIEIALQISNGHADRYHTQEVRQNGRLILMLLYRSHPQKFLQSFLQKC